MRGGLAARACCARLSGLARLGGFATLSGLVPAASAAPAPACAPATLNRSALLAEQVTVSPLPGSRDASQRAQVSFLGVPAADVAEVSVVGSRSGKHAGRLEAYSQGDGASFVPASAFAAGEHVTVRARLLQAGGGAVPIAFGFTVAVPDTGVEAGGSPKPASQPRDYQYFHSRPDLRPPLVTVTSASAAASPGDMLLAPYSGPGQYGPMILAPDGSLLWFKALPAPARAADLQVQALGGQPVLTWWQDPIVAGGHGGAGIVIANGAYQTIDVVRAGNGYQPDLHEFQITPQETAWITVYSGVRCNLAGLGGPSEGAVADTIVQELDLRTGLVMYEWHALDHVPMSDSYVSALPGSVKEPFDFFHVNSIDPEGEGDVLVDARNTWAAYEIDARSGRVLWQLGGKRSSFKLGAGAAIAFQHDARRLPDGNLTFFDNGATPRVHSQSRAIEVALDTHSMTATLVRRDEHAPALLAGSQGNVQALDDGDWMVGWGQQPYMTEYGPSGQVLFDAHLPIGYESYRVFREPWAGQPVNRPALSYAAPRHAGDVAVVYASWNGASAVASWRVLAGRSAAAASLLPVASAARGGFETAIRLPAPLPAGGYVAVQALSGAGAVLASSAPSRS